MCMISKQIKDLFDTDYANSKNRTDVAKFMILCNNTYHFMSSILRIHKYILNRRPIKTEKYMSQNNCTWIE